MTRHWINDGKETGWHEPKGAVDLPVGKEPCSVVYRMRRGPEKSSLLVVDEGDEVVEVDVGKKRFLPARDVDWEDRCDID